MAKAKFTATGFLLARGDSPTREAQTFGLFPGEWVPGKVKLPAEIGMTADEVREAIAELDLPLKEVEVGAASEEALAKAIDQGRVNIITEVEGERVEAPADVREATTEPKPDEPEAEKAKGE